MLEDDYTDVIRKASVGCGLGEEQLIQELGLDAQGWQAFLAGDFDLELAKRVAKALKLKPEAFSKHPIYHPKPLELAGVKQMELPFGQWTVNCWWVEKDGASIVFDAGMGSEDLIEALTDLPGEVFITHGHHDHVGGVEALIGKGVPVHGAEFSGSRELKVGDMIECGALRLKVCDLSGHYVPAVGYHIEGLDRPVLVVGDALFAGSMGKTPDPERYQLALHTLKEAIKDLPDEAVLLSGHGPATTVGEERVSNPFL